MAKNVIEVGLKLNDQFSARMKRAGGVVGTFARGIKTQMAGIGRAFGMVTAPIRGMFRTVTNLKTLLIGFAGFKLTEFAVSIEGVERHFRVLLEALGEDAPKTLARLRAAFHGTVSDIDLMRQTNEALTLEAVQSGDQLEMLATLARRLGRAMGIDMNTAFKSLVVGIARQSRLWLDNVGIIVRVEDANKKLAQQLGTTVDKLTDTQKRTGFMNAVVEAAQRKLEMLGEDVESVADSWAKLGATMKNIATDVLKAWGPVFSELFDRIRDWLVTNRKTIIYFFADLLDAADRVFPAILQEVERLTKAFWEMVKPLMKISEFLAKRELTEAATMLRGAETEFRKRAAFAERKQKGAFKGDWDPYAFTPIPGGAAERQSMESVEKYYERIINLKLIDERSALARRLAEAIQRKKEADEAYLRSIGEYAGVSITGESLLGGVAAQLRASADRREKEDYLEIYRQAEEQRQKMLRMVYGATQGPPGVGVPLEMEQMEEKLTELYSATRHVKTGFDGLVDGLRRIYEVGVDTFSQIRDLVTHTGDLLVDRIADSLTQIAMRTKQAGQAFKEMALSIGADLTRLIIKMMLMRALSAGLGFLGGSMGIGEPQMIPFRAGVGISGKQRGGVAGPYEPVIGGEGARAEAFVPLPDGRTIPVTLSGAGASGQTIINYYRIDATDAQSFDRLLVQGLGRQQDVVGMVNNRQYQDRPALRRAYS